MPIMCDHDVVGLQVAMNNSCGVRLCQPFRDMLQVSQQLSQCSALAMNLLAERNAFHKLHRNEVRAIVFPDLEDLRNVGMAQCRRRFSLANETLHPIAIRRHVSGKNLERDLTSESHVLGQISLAHSAFADLRADFVTAESCARGQTMVGHPHFSFSYSFFASIRMDTSASASFQSAKKS